jgi:hypothetical protein
MSSELLDVDILPASKIESCRSLWNDMRVGFTIQCGTKEDEVGTQGRDGGENGSEDLIQRRPVYLSKTSPPR